MTNAHFTTLRRLLVGMLLLLVLAGCGGTNAPVGVSNVTLIAPTNASAIYASALYVSGTAQGAGTLRITLESADGLFSASATLPASQTWSIEIPHGYSGEPTPVTVAVYAVDSTHSEPLASTQVLLSALAHRPEGEFLDVIQPFDGEELGGDVLEVIGRVSGYPPSGIKVALVGSDGLTIAETVITPASPFAVDDVTWTAELPLHNVTGSALIRVEHAQAPAITIPIVLSSSAG